MNRQDKWKDGVLVGRGIEWTLIFGKHGYTANPVRGCKHACQWEMPDGSIATCYAKEIAERFTAAYPNGFEEITWHPEELEEIKSKANPCGIFIDSMSDLFGQGVKREWIAQVIETIRACPQHVFFSLTKNPSRFRDFAHDQPWPANWLVGISAPPTFMFGKKLTIDQQRAWLRRALEFLRDSPAKTRWISIEPLSFDVSEIVREFRDGLQFAVVGAASNGSKTHQPDPMHFANTLDALFGVKVFFKGNINHALADEIAGGWREEFPKIEMQPALL